MTHEEPSQDRRHANRLRYNSRIRLSIDSESIEGSAENISRTGVLFHTDGTIKVMIEIEEGGMIKKVPGRLIRTERLGDAEQGWAVEFDAA